MNILAIDTSMQATSCALLQVTDKTTTLLAANYLNVALTHSETSQVLAENCLQAAQLTLKDIDYFVAVNGPGSFTGLRIGVTLVKTWAYSQNKPCIAVSSLSTLAAAVMDLPEDTCLIPCLDARNERVYLQVEVAGKIVIPAQATAFASIKEQLQVKLPQTVKKIKFISTGKPKWADKYAATFQPEFTAINWQITELSAVQAAKVAALQIQEQRAKLLPYNELVPNYLALSQAERQRQLKK